MGCRNNGLSEQWAVGVMGCRNNATHPLFRCVNRDGQYLQKGQKNEEQSGSI